MTYSFVEQLAQGKRHEAFLDSYFATDFYIRPASADEERLGIDRHFTLKSSGQRFTVQYKADSTASRTGNAFIETVSVDRDSVPGWAYTCTADYLIYYIPPMGLAYLVQPWAIRERVKHWQKKFQCRSIPNKGYKTIGILVPLDEIERISDQVISL